MKCIIYMKIYNKYIKYIIKLSRDSHEYLINDNAHFLLIIRQKTKIK